MPPPARISVPVKQPMPVKSADNSTPKTPASIPRPKARVVHRRRARGRLDDTDTDDDLEREPHSDSDSDSAASTLDSESISDSEPEQESKSEARVSSPSRTPLVPSGSASSAPHSPAKVSIFPQSHDWSDMVADENANGAAALPVIDFADLSSHAQTTSPPAHTVPSSPPSVQEEPGTSRGTAISGPSSTATRKAGQSARQAYLTRLDNDPAYVPTLGQFWSHDDRLLDKDLRSLSGWWRGRWQGRGRGPRGRGGFAGGWGMRGRGALGNSGGTFHPEDVPEEEAPPAERAWTHDGFEEMKKADESKRQQNPFRGRGGFSRGRGGFKGGFPVHGGLAPTNRSSSPLSSLARPQSESQHSSTSDTLKFGNGARPWFVMKPERVWTKQFDGYLYFEAQLKPVHNQGLGQGVRIKLPGTKGTSDSADGLDNEAVVVRLPQRNAVTPRSVPPAIKEPLPDRAIVVKLPPSKKVVKEREALAPEDIITVAPPPMEEPLPPHRLAPTPPYRTRPTHDAPPHIPSRTFVPPVRRASDVVVSISQTAASIAAPSDQPVPVPQLQRTASENSFTSSNLANAGPSQLHVRVDSQGAENAEEVPPQSQPPILPTLQAVAPPFQPSPPYGSPYAYPAPGLPLPPGIAVSETGVTYEIATGRAVYLHTPPPPPPPPPMQVPMYNPRPMPMHHAHHGSVHFLPHQAHGHTPSMSMSVSPPAFLSSPPIFALPRQSSRIEIKAPGEDKGKEREAPLDHTNSQGRPAGSRMAVNVNAEPFTPASHAQSQAMGYYADTQQQAFDDAQRHHQHQQSMYQPTSYYYPVGADGSTPYGYGQQYANVDGSQPQQYDAYGQDPYPQQHAVYY